VRDRRNSPFLQPVARGRVISLLVQWVELPIALTRERRTRLRVLRVRALLSLPNSVGSQFGLRSVRVAHPY
jgi:hypothetical protein